MMIVTAVLALLTVFLMIGSVFLLPQVRFGKFRIGGYCFFAVLGAVALVVAGSVSLPALRDGIFGAGQVNPLKLLLLFLSMTVFSIVLDELGFFRWLAVWVLERAGNSQWVLFFCLYVIASVLTVFTSNDIVILTFTPFICSFCRRAGIRPLPYLIAEFAAANTWSMALLIGNPTNIYITAATGIDFFSYIGVMFLPTVAAGAVSLGMLLLLFHRSLAEPMQTVCEPEELADRPLLVLALAHLFVCLMLLTASGYIGLEMWLCSSALAVSLILCTLLYHAITGGAPGVLWRTVRRMPWELVPFLLSMFTLVMALSESGWLARLSSLFGTEGAVFTYGISSFLVANLVNNIPMSVLYAGLIDISGGLPAAYATVIGSNLGACLTPVGALAGIMWSDILRREGVSFRYGDFLRYGAAISLPALAAALGALMLTLP